VVDFRSFSWQHEQHDWISVFAVGRSIGLACCVVDCNAMTVHNLQLTYTNNIEKHSNIIKKLNVLLMAQSATFVLNCLLLLTFCSVITDIGNRFPRSSQGWWDGVKFDANFCLPDCLFSWFDCRFHLWKTVILILPIVWTRNQYFFNVKCN